MKTTKYIKILNETETGHTGTNDTYMLISSQTDISDIFPTVNEDYMFIDKETQDRYYLRLTSAREKRITKLGIYYRAKNVMGGSRILLELTEDNNGQVDRFIDIINPTSLFLQYSSSHGFKIMNDHENILENSKLYLDREGGKRNIQLTFSDSILPRRNSKELVNYYDLLIDDRHYQDIADVSNNEIIEISKIEDEDFYVINRRLLYTKITMEVNN